MKSIITFLTLVTIGTSCDSYNPVDYNIINNSSKEIKVIFNQWEYDQGMYITNDTIVSIAPHQKENLLIREIIGASVWNPETGNDTIWAINKLEIFRDDTILVNKNFRMMNYWQYNNLGRHHAELNLVLKDQDIF
ncbi:MAG: hypothetical protein QM802_04210 [Agriterribacter sp.]